MIDPDDGMDAWRGSEPPNYDDYLNDHSAAFCGAWVKADGLWQCCENPPGCMADPEGSHKSGFDRFWRDAAPDATDLPTRPAPLPSPVGTQVVYPRG